MTPVGDAAKQREEGREREGEVGSSGQGEEGTGGVAEEDSVRKHEGRVCVCVCVSRL